MKVSHQSRKRRGDREEEKDSSSSPNTEPEHRAERKSSDEVDLTTDDSSNHDPPPPLPREQPPPRSTATTRPSPHDDGWDPVWDDTAQAFYFYNRFTQSSQWSNPRVPAADNNNPSAALDSAPQDRRKSPSADDAAPPARPYTGYDPSIHGDYDPTAPYAQEHVENDDHLPSTTVAAAAASNNGEIDSSSVADPSAIYAATGTFNRFTGKWQAQSLNPENHNDENKSRRQMSAFFDVDAAANSHNGKSLKAERSGKKLTKQELKAFKEKRKEKKEERRRAWLRD